MFFSIIISRLKAWLRSLLDDDTSFGMSQPQTIPDAAGALVERSRQGDQNAIAMICQIRDAAARGEPRAQQTAAELQKYIKKHPTDNQMGYETETDAMANEILACFGAEQDYLEIMTQKVLPLAHEDIKKAIVTVSHGPILFPTNGESLVRQIGEALPEGEVREAFKLGATEAATALNAMQGMNHDMQHALILGYVLGKARALQLVRIPEIPVKVQSELAGCELD